MRLYFNENVAAQMLHGVPKALHQRTMDQAEEFAHECGVTTVVMGPGWVDAALDRTRREDVFRFLNGGLVACVDVRPEDVTCIFGNKGLDALVLCRGLETDPAVVAQLSRILPEEIIEKCRQISYTLQSQPANPEPTNADERWLADQHTAAAKYDLIARGMIQPDDYDPLAPPVQPEPTIGKEFQSDPEPEEGEDDPFDGDPRTFGM